MHALSWRSVIVTSFLVTVMSQSSLQNVIFRQALFPFFTEKSDDPAMAAEPEASPMAAEPEASPAEKRPLGRGRRGGAAPAPASSAAARADNLRRMDVSSIPCPPDMTEYECLHTFMAVWTRVMQEDRLADMENLALLRGLSG
ncbi:uncharacterized protein LOC143301556 [Babylonia areolata]|uniref:uncharacterized protein LOC143301556 n=1 Tax=Babylonia areolata TaxID=304850 RepID=UPI003FD3C69B